MDLPYSYLLHSWKPETLHSSPMADEANRTVSLISISIYQSFSILASGFLLYMINRLIKTHYRIKLSTSFLSTQLDLIVVFCLEQTKQAFLELQGRMIETTSKFKQVIWIPPPPPVLGWIYCRIVLMQLYDILLLDLKGVFFQLQLYSLKKITCYGGSEL
jgi:hypothetical protein